METPKTKTNFAEVVYVGTSPGRFFAENETSPNPRATARVRVPHCGSPRERAAFLLEHLGNVEPDVAEYLRKTLGGR